MDRQRDRDRALHRDHDQQHRGIAARDADDPPGGGWDRDEATVAWIYGSILVATTVVVAASVVASEPVQVLPYTAATMIAIWLVHSYAAFVGHGGRVHVHGLGARARHAMGAELPVLASATPTLIAIAIAWLAGAGVYATGLAGLIAAIATMTVVAAAAARRAGAGPLGIAAAAVSALILGALLVAVKIALK